MSCEIIHPPPGFRAVTRYRLPLRGVPAGRRSGVPRPVRAGLGGSLETPWSLAMNPAHRPPLRGNGGNRIRTNPGLGRPGLSHRTPLGPRRLATSNGPRAGEVTHGRNRPHSDGIRGRTPISAEVPDGVPGHGRASVIPELPRSRAVPSIRHGPWRVETSLGFAGWGDLRGHTPLGDLSHETVNSLLGRNLEPRRGGVC